MATLARPDRTRLRNRAPLLLAWAAVLLAALWCVWMLVGLAWALLTPLTAGAPVASGSAASHRAGSAPVPVSGLHLFGNGHAAETRRQMLTAGQATRLQLTLHGTVAGTGNGGYALIADAQGLERSYQVGDRIQDGVTLRAVFPTHVVLDHDGRNERLDLPRQSLEHADAVQPLPHTGARRAAPGTDAAPGGAARTPIYVAPRLAHGRVDWQELRQSAQRDPARVIAQLQLQPVFEGTELRGVRLGGGTTNPLLAGTGLRSSDVVTAVNGIRLDSVARGQQLFHELKDARQVHLTVLRDGHSQTIDINLSQLH